MDKKDAHSVFERIRKNIEEKKLIIGDTVISLTISIGVTIQIASTLEETIRKADKLLYKVKEFGRNRVVVG